MKLIALAMDCTSTRSGSVPLTVSAGLEAGVDNAPEQGGTVLLNVQMPPTVMLAVPGEPLVSAPVAVLEHPIAVDRRAERRVPAQRPHIMGRALPATTRVGLIDRVLPGALKVALTTVTPLVAPAHPGLHATITPSHSTTY